MGRNKFVSSAYVIKLKKLVEDLKILDLKIEVEDFMSLTYMRKNRGPRIVP